MKYQILKPTKCHVNNHVWIFASGSSTSEPPLGMKCDCEEYTWEAMKAFQQSVQRTVDQPCVKHNMEFCSECFPVVVIDFNRR